MVKKSKRVFVHHHLSREKLRTLYRKATGYLTASHYEIFNFPILEALSQKCPVIGLETAIIPELSAYCSIAKNEEEFVQKMNIVASGKAKTPELESIRKAFSWESYVRQLTGLYA